MRKFLPQDLNLSLLFREMEEAPRSYAVYKSSKDILIRGSTYLKSTKKPRGYRTGKFCIKYENEEVFTLSKQVCATNILTNLHSVSSSIQ